MYGCYKYGDENVHLLCPLILQYNIYFYYSFIIAFQIFISSKIEYKFNNIFYKLKNQCIKIIPK